MSAALTRRRFQLSGRLATADIFAITSLATSHSTAEGMNSREVPS
jgi:hypothetical protein